MSVSIDLSDAVESIKHLERCGQQLEAFCVVTENVSHGTPVRVKSTTRSAGSCTKRDAAHARNRPSYAIGEAIRQSGRGPGARHAIIPSPL